MNYARPSPSVCNHIPSHFYPNLTQKHLIFFFFCFFLRSISLKILCKILIASFQRPLHSPYPPTTVLVHLWWRKIEINRHLSLLQCKYFFLSVLRNLGFNSFFDWDLWVWLGYFFAYSEMQNLIIIFFGFSKFLDLWGCVWLTKKCRKLGKYWFSASQRGFRMAS